MAYKIKFDFDSLTPDLREKARALQDTGPVAQAAVSTLKQIAELAFRDSNFRPIEWPARKFPAAHALLMKSGQLSRSLRVRMAGSTAYLESDKAYAAVHQFGVSHSWKIKPRNKKALRIPGIGPRGSVTIKGIPARPFVPVGADGTPTETATRWMLDAINTRLRSLLRMPPPGSISGDSVLGRLG